MVSGVSAPKVQFLCIKENDNCINQIFEVVCESFYLRNIFMQISVEKIEFCLQGIGICCKNYILSNLKWPL